MAVSNVPQLIRVAVVVAVLLVALPLGAFLGGFTISILAENIITGVLVLAGSVTITAAIGLGLYIVAEGEIPSFLRKQ